MNTFLDVDEYIIPLQPAPRTVESVINHRVYRARNILAIVSGGVHVDPQKVAARDRRQIDQDGALAKTRSETITSRDNRSGWWWE